MSLFQVLEIAEGLLQLDPVRTYPRRAAEHVARLARAPAFRLELDEETLESDPPPSAGSHVVSLPLRNGREVLGTLHLHLKDGESRLAHDELRLARWGARVLARGMSYASRLSAESGRRSGEDVSETLERAPLTPRERDVVSLLVSGASTRDIASRTGLTVSTVNTYLKRIFAKLGVHSRVELVARVAGTDAATPSAPPPDTTSG
ncbi:MAG: helix-turn-helix transcriptional regulator [Polyangiales bacterium]